MAEEVKRIFMASQEVLQALADGELDIQHAAVTEHHRKEAQAPAGGVAGIGGEQLLAMRTFYLDYP